jgi:hypothetical protein
MDVTFVTNWGNSEVRISANFNRASCRIIGANGRNTAEFQYSPAEAMRYVIEQKAIAQGLDLRNRETREQINASVSCMHQR